MADQVTDSLRALIEHTTDPVKQAGLLTELARASIGSDPDVAHEYLNQALRLVEKHNQPAVETEALIMISDIYRRMGRLDTARVIMMKCIRINETNGDSNDLADSYVSFANIVRRQSDFDSAILYYRRSLSIYASLQNVKGMIKAYNALGIIYKHQAAYDSAAYYYLETLRLSEAINYDIAISASLINLGKVYMLVGDYEKARKYNLRSIEHNKTDSNIDFLALAYTNLGIIAYDLKNYDSALIWYQQALAMQEKIGNQIGMNNLYNNIGNVYKEKRWYNSAISYYDKALLAFKNIGYPEGITNTLMNKATALADAGRTDESQQLYDSCLVIARSTGDIDLQKDLFLNKYDIYKKVGDYKNALESQAAYYQLKDSIDLAYTQAAIAELSMKYEDEKYQANILSLTNENLQKDLDLRKRTSQRNVYLVTGIGVILLSLLLLRFYRHKRTIALQRITQLEGERKLLAARFLVEGQEEERKRIAKDLHDGLGVLLATARMQFSGIRDANRENKLLIEKAGRLLEQAATDVRRISHNMMPGLLVKFGFFEAAEALIEQVDDTGRIRASIYIEGAPHRFDEKTEIMLYRILQEMVNNTLKHAGAAGIRVEIQIMQQGIRMIYEDNGKGFDVDEKLNSQSIGLNSIQSRVNYLGGVLNIKSAPGRGVKFTVEVPTKPANAAPSEKILTHKNN